MNEIEIDEGFEVEASPTFFGSGGGGGLVEEDEDDIEQLPQQDDESTMNDESTTAASSYISRGYSYVASNTKWVIIAMASFAVFFGIGIGLGYGPIGNSIYGNDDASSVSSVMAVDFAASDHGDKSDGGAKSGKSKSDKSSGAKAGKATLVPTQSPSSSPTRAPTMEPSKSPSRAPSGSPTSKPTEVAGPVGSRRLDLPPYVSTFSSSIRTRGYFFQAPIDFQIVGLNVPNEANEALQNVEVFIMDSQPPEFGASSSGGSVFYANMAPEDQVIATDICVPAGKWVGILGATGTTTMNNSYGAGCVGSSIDGQPIELRRFLTQQSIANAQTRQYSANGCTGQIARVDLFYVPESSECPASALGDISAMLESNNKDVMELSYDPDSVPPSDLVLD